jgi:phosphatidylserine decarboxylase
VENIRYRSGRFRAAFNDMASIENEQNTLTIEGDSVRIECSQVAGMVARRIVCWARSGDTLKRGERIGLIRFGSRTDLLLPPNVEVDVSIGEKVRGGSSVIGHLLPGRTEPTA